MSIIYYIFIAIASILSSLVLMARFTDFIQMIHIVLAGVFLGLIFISSIFAHYFNKKQKKVKSKRSGPGKSFVRGKNSKDDSSLEILNDINNLLRENPARNMISIPSVDRQLKKEIMDKEKKKMVEYWAVIAETKVNRTPVKIIYNKEEHKIPDYERDPPAHKRDEPFTGFEPQKLTRVASHSYDDEEEDDDDKNMDFKLEASAGKGDSGDE